MFSIFLTHISPFWRTYSSNDIYIASTDFGPDFRCAECLAELVAKHLVRPEVVQIVMRAHQQWGGTASFAIFFVFNSFEDEGVSYITSVPPSCTSIEDVADFVESLDVPAHADNPTTDALVRNTLREFTHGLKERGMKVKFVCPDDY